MVQSSSRKGLFKALGINQGRLWTDRLSTLFYACCTVILLGIGAYAPQNLQETRAFTYDVTTPLIATVSSPFQAVGTWMHEGLRSHADLRAENARLRAQIDQLTTTQALTDHLRQENQELQQLLGRQENNGHSFTTARIIADMSSPFYHAVMLDRGARHGITHGQAVISDLGLVGRVVTVGYLASRVLLLTDVNSRVPAMIAETGQKIIVGGNNTKTLELMYVPEETQLVEGQTIVTSGHGGIFGAGIPIGHISLEKTTASDTQKTRQHANVIPFVDITRLSFVQAADFQKDIRIEDPTHATVVTE